MKILIALTIVILVNTQQAVAEDSHSVEAIQAALKSPIPPQMLQQASQFDAQVMQTHEDINGPVTLITDARYLRCAEIVGKLLRSINRDPSEWVVRVFDTNTKIINAYVVGGQFIYIYTGLLDDVESDDELAFVLSHEISHSVLKHKIRRTEDTSSVVGSLIQLGGALSRNQRVKNNLELAGGAIISSYARDDEREADALGAFIASRAGYDPSKSISFFNRMIQLEQSNNQKLQNQIESQRQIIEKQVVNCEQLKSQWNSQPQIRSAQNAQTINSVCSNAATNAQQYNSYIDNLPKSQIRFALLRDHPVDEDRINSISMECDFLAGRRPLESLRNIGQGYEVLMAIDASPFK